MNVHLLFGSKKPLDDWGAPWLKGGQEHTHLAVRNPGGKAALSSLLAKSLMAVLQGEVKSALACELVMTDENWNRHPGYFAEIASHSTPGKLHTCWMTESRARFGFPYGGAGRLTYHVGILPILDALQYKAECRDFWRAYAALLDKFNGWGLSPDIEAEFLRAADELYYLLRYHFAAPSPAADALETAQACAHNAAQALKGSEAPFDLELLRDPDRIRRELGEPHKRAIAPVPTPIAAVDLNGFKGWQGRALYDAIGFAENCLLAGPTGTGKTLLTYAVAQAHKLRLALIEGKEGMLDMDFLGAILPQEDGSRQWVDGPLLRAMRDAQFSPVLLFIDEINRLPREHLNLLIGLMNPKSVSVLAEMGLDLEAEGDFYTVEVPMTSELVICPTAHLRIVAAGNFGAAYAVYDLDPALRSRFATVIEFDYLPFGDEVELVVERTRLKAKVAKALVKLAGETRRMAANGEVPGVIDTRSLLNWAAKCQRANAVSVADVMAQARLSWADIVCGRDGLGKVQTGVFDALSDYLTTQGALP